MAKMRVIVVDSFGIEDRQHKHSLLNNPRAGGMNAWSSGGKCLIGGVGTEVNVTLLPACQLIQVNQKHSLPIFRIYATYKWIAVQLYVLCPH